MEREKIDDWANVVFLILDIAPPLHFCNHNVNLKLVLTLNKNESEEGQSLEMNEKEKTDNI